LKLRFLGTGTSFGVPVIGCDCRTCTSADPRDRRTRHGAVLEEGERRVLIDTPPELRLQLLHAGIGGVEAVWFTHIHADHVAGVDDLRAFSVRGQGPFPVFASAECIGELTHRFAYIFDPAVRPHEGTSKPEARLRPLDPFEEVEVGGFAMLPLPVPHGSVEAFGFRCGALGYITDAKRLPPAVLNALKGVRVLVLNALWYGQAHPTHFSVEDAVEAAAAVGAEQTYLTHLSHRVLHAELEERLPPGVRPAHDGLVVEI